SASSMALEVLFPKAPILVPFCLYRGKFSNRLLTPLGVKKHITSNSDFVSTCFTSLLMVLYINGVANSHLLALSQLIISLSCWFSEQGYKNCSFSLCLFITSNRLLFVPSAP